MILNVILNKFARAVSLQQNSLGDVLHMFFGRNVFGSRRTTAKQVRNLLTVAPNDFLVHNTSDEVPFAVWRQLRKVYTYFTATPQSIVEQSYVFFCSVSDVVQFREVYGDFPVILAGVPVLFRKHVYLFNTSFAEDTRKRSHYLFIGSSVMCPVYNHVG